jgi:hypothetical protein
MDRTYSNYYRLKFWRLLHDRQTAAYAIIPDRLPTLQTDPVRAIRGLDLQSLGPYFATVEWCVKATMMFILVNQPTPAQRQIWSDYLKFQFTANQLCCLDMYSLIGLADSLQERRRGIRPGTAIHEMSFHHLHAPQNEHRVKVYNRTLVTFSVRHWMTACLPWIQSRFSTLQFNTLCRGYGQGRLRYRDMRNPVALPVLIHSRVQAINHTPSGPLVPLSSFCTYRPALVYLICAICTTRIDDPPFDPRNYLVTTRCAHYFQQSCLNGWVNLSARRDADTCPVCQRNICRPGRQRHRIHKGYHFQV